VVEYAIVGGKADGGLPDDHGLNVMMIDRESIMSELQQRRIEDDGLVRYSCGGFAGPWANNSRLARTEIVLIFATLASFNARKNCFTIS
jgi:hypothetical protein